MHIPFIFRVVFNRALFFKIFALLLLIAFLWIFQWFIVVFFITFLFSYLFLDLGKNLHEKFTDRVSQLQHSQARSWLLRNVSINAIVTVLYISFIVVIILLVSTLVPKLVEEWSRLVDRIPAITDQVKNELVRIDSYARFDLGIRETINEFFDRENIQEFMKTTLSNLQNIGIFLFQLIVALILSYVFIMDRAKIAEYLSGIRSSHFSFLYTEYSIIFKKIEKGFGLVFKAQAIIALVNAFLTAAGLLLIGAIFGPENNNSFPYIITLSTIVFIFGFIPVLGIVLSSIPILIIGYTYGGPSIVIGILIMTAVIHAVEAYYLNPKIVSSYMEFPVFVTFVILLVSESLFGLIGLLIGVPLFYILVDVLKDLDRAIGHIKIAHSRMIDAQKETKASIDSGIRLSRSGRRGE